MVLVFGVILFVVMLLMGVPIAYGMLSTTLFGMAFLPNVELITVSLALSWNSGMVSAPQLHMVDLILSSVTAMLSLSGPA